MTSAGEYNVNHLNTVKIPTVSMCIGQSFVPTTTNAGNTGIGCYNDGKNVYYLDDTTGFLYTASFRDPVNAVLRDNAQLLPTAMPYNAYPLQIAGNYYAYGVKDITGTTPDASIWSAPGDSPYSWHDTGVDSASGSTDAMIYVDSTGIYLLGGVNIDGTTYLDSIDVAVIGSPTVFVASSNVLPAPRIFSSLIAVGGTIYMYGGTTDGSTSLDTIYTASTSDPTTWIDSGSTLPITMDSATPYFDSGAGIVYLFGGTNSGGATDLDTIYTADVSDPLTFTDSGTLLPAKMRGGRLIKTQDALYLVGTSAGGGTGVMTASLTDPLTWTQLNQSSAVSTAIRYSHVGIQGSKVYAFGGQSNVIQSAPVSHPTNWTNEISTLPTTLTSGQIIKTKTYFYIIGGEGITGNYYRAPLTAPTTWTLVDGTGPNVTGGRCVIVDNQLFYFGGAGMGGSTAVGWRALIVNGEIVNWLQTPGSNMSLDLPTALSNFSLLQSGDYIYVLGGTNGASLINAVIYRCHKNRLSQRSGFVGWTSVGSLASPTVHSSVAVIGSRVFLIGGETTGPVVNNHVISASMDDLANGSAIFLEENTATLNLAGAVATCVNDDLYLVGGITTILGSATTTLYRNLSWSRHNLISPKIPESVVSLPTIDSKSGNLGSYSIFQRSGVLPWLTTDK